MKSLPMFAGACVVAALATGGWMQVAAAGVRDDADASNRAVRDPAGLRVAASAGAAVERIFSYSAADPATTGAYADKILTGTAANQYRLLFQQVTANAPAQKLTLTTKVKATAVSHFDDSRAVVLVFCDQRAVRAGRPATTAAADLLVTVENRAGRWLISGIQAV